MYRIVLFTENEKHFTLPSVKKVCENLSQEIEICAIVVSEKFGNRSMWPNVKRFYPLLKLKGILLTLLDELLLCLLGTITNKYRVGLQSFSRIYRIPIFATSNVNSPEFEQQLKKLSPDLCVSMSFGQVLKSNIIAIPKHGAINLHASLLPRYRGLMPNFWVLLNGETETGVTVHYIEEGIDTGGIILQKKIQIPQKTTYHQLVQISKAVGTQCLTETIRRFSAEGKITPRKTAEKGDYYGFPKKKDFAVFWSRGGSYR